ncbi:phosphoenolpyruvate synthase [Rhabdobacter roseus]|uniref:Pyruvate,water dikinase n=1 Tax=Rhabdobacter roseus TaxID=1655419 RepID=A0A840TGG6_9BACT|nr:PEP/pyruvate-binding domain-containing protein [Rhabdobacter roseus]MBB5282311.1 pyruvate,water dikinase [Rhabdobacter roseus]
MSNVLHTDPNPTGTLGGKAKNLFRLQEMGLRVPPFAVLPVEVLEALVPQEIRAGDAGQIRAFIAQSTLPAEWVTEILAHFPEARYLAVRSSAPDEDGTTFSFAGQFESYLYVPPSSLADRIRDVWASAFSERVAAYRKHHQAAGAFGMAVILQEMIDAEVAGVAFGANIANGRRDEKLISAVFGLGEGLVSGELNADHFTVRNGEIVSQLAHKTHQVVLNPDSSGGTCQVPLEPHRHDAPTLTPEQIRQIADALEVLAREWGSPQDIEFAIKNNTLFLLQTRPITGLPAAPDVSTPESEGSSRESGSGEYTLWDNSNIIESYPGVTTPLTFSFIRQSYEVAYSLFSQYLGVSERVVKENQAVFANTLGLINGRVYYNLKTWYHMLAMLPGYSLNARFMENMMGVKERFDIPDNYRLSKGQAGWRILKMAVRMYARYLSLPRKRREFMALLEKTITHYKGLDYPAKSAHELMQLYRHFEGTLLNEWKAPLLNDFFAMIWFGRLQKQCEKYLPQFPNIHNDLLCGSSDIISVQPIHRTGALASQILADDELKDLFITGAPSTLWQRLQESTAPNYLSLKKSIDQYLADFGERCVGELKLETVSYAHDPTQFIQILKTYVETGLTTERFSARAESQIRQQAEQQLEQALRGRPYVRWQLKSTLRKARELVSARENLRYERTRAFGIVRELFTYMGRRFEAEGLLDDDRAIFYLTQDEIFALIEGTSVTQNARALVALRQAEFEKYHQQDPPPERFATYGPVYQSTDFEANRQDEPQAGEGTLKGIGCSPGKVRARARVVLHPGEVPSLNGDILVTTSTDPGWVMLFPSASGIIVERGSLLSHSAIVSREMGKPCIVGVTGLLKTIKTGDELEMDGSTGHIRIIQPES